MKEGILFPLILPLLMATLSLLPRRWRFDRELMALLGNLAHLVFSLLLFFQIRAHGVQTLQIGAWPAPFGITLVADLLSASMLIITGLVGFLITLYSLGSLDSLRQSFGYFPLLHVVVFGCSGVFVAGDLFNLFVWFEVILIASFVLLTLGGEREQIIAGVKYVTLNGVASTFFLTGIGLLYLQMGTLNLADLFGKLAQVPAGGVLSLTLLFLLITFLIKAGSFPFFFWLPASYPTPPIAVSALFAALLTKVGVYVLLRFFSLVLLPSGVVFSGLLSWAAGLTMVLGVLGAWSQMDIRRILSFHIISQIGYMLMGISFLSPLALSGAIYFMFHNITAKTNLFLLGGVIALLGGSYRLEQLGGLFRSFGLLGTLFLFAALSLAGIPPLAGFLVSSP